jgi:hypothetical protein
MLCAACSGTAWQTGCGCMCDELDASLAGQIGVADCVVDGTTGPLPFGLGGPLSRRLVLSGRFDCSSSRVYAGLTAAARQ